MGRAHTSAPQTPARGNAVPRGQKPLALTMRRDEGLGRLSPYSAPQTPTRLWPAMKEPDWEKVRGGVEGRGKKSLRRLGLVGWLPPPHRRLERGALGAIGEGERGWGYRRGGSGHPSDCPEGVRGGVAGYARRGGRARGSARRAARPRSPAATPGLLPAARLGACCFLLGIALLRSCPAAGGPAPSRARGPAVSLASPRVLRLLPGGS